MTERTNTIRNLNDRFRRGDPTVTGQVFITRGLVDLLETANAPSDVLLGIVRTHNDFSDNSDPYGEHDFGAFDFKGEKCVWKIEYYTHDLRSGAENPADTRECMRVMTIMLATDY